MAHTYIYAGGKLIRETYGSTTMDFLYDASGRPYAFYYNGTLYYYVLNLQGDVIQLLDSSGNLIANYSYDAWGKVTVSDIAGGYSAVANANPLRYRGYYYDSETGFYYLQSRYYDPAICRFINADAFASTGQGFIGYNMFAYCNNNPVNFEDSSGCALKPNTTFINDGVKQTPGPVGTISSDDWHEMQESCNAGYDYIWNTDENVVTEADCLAFYKGVPFLKVGVMGDSAFSFGIVLMGPNAGGEDMVRHEYGHAIHMKEIGAWDYLDYVAIPSITYFHKNGVDEHYYSLPWEYAAEIRGQVNREGGKYRYQDYADEWYNHYFSEIG